MNEMAWSNLVTAVRDLTKSNNELLQEMKLMKMKINQLIALETKPTAQKKPTV